MRSKLRYKDMPEKLLEVQSLSVTFGTTPVVTDLSFDLEKGGCLGIVGESGSGKSLTALSIMQLLPSTARVSQNSKILYQSKDLLSESESAMRHVRGKQIGMIFQDAMSAFNPVLTVGQQLYEITKTHLGLTMREAKQHIYSMLDQVGIDNVELCYRSYPHQLSGGMRQRAMIAMALCGQPEILIADEPTTSLDVTLQAQVLNLLKDLQQKQDMTLIFISHDLAVVSQLADDILVMQQGKMVEESKTRDFFENPKELYTQKLLAAIPSNTPRHTEPTDTPSLLTVDNLKVYFPIRQGIFQRPVDYVRAVDDIRLSIPKGQTLALVGESGSGKTTTGKSIICLQKATTGKITFEDKVLEKISNRKLKKLRNDMQIIFQDPFASLNPRMMIFDCISEGLFAQKKVRTRKQAGVIVDEMLDRVSLERSMKWRYPHEFSGGQRQRICIARALALKPKLLILDEPTSALDASIQMQILGLLDQLQQDLGLTYLLITHNLAVVAYLAHHVAVMHRGKIVESGACAELLANPRNAYTQALLSSIPEIKTHAGTAQ